MRLKQFCIGISYYTTTPLKFTAHGVHARESESDNDQPTATVIFGDNRSHSELLDLELELSIDDGPELPQKVTEKDCPSPEATTGIYFPSSRGFVCFALSFSTGY